MSKRFNAKSGDIVPLQDLFKDFEQFKRADACYSIVENLDVRADSVEERLGTAQRAWDANPLIEVGWDNQPVYYRKYREPEDYSRFNLWEPSIGS